MAGDGLLLDVADAVAARQQVDWDRAHGGAPLDQRRSLDSLRDLSRMFAAVTGSPDAGSSGATASGELYGTWFLRFALVALVAVAALQVAAALVAISWSWEHQWGQQFVAPRMLALVTLSGCALLLLIGGRRDHRARLLGVVFALSASSFSWPFVELVASNVHPWLFVEVFQPTLMWAFAREFRGSIDEPGSMIWRAGWCLSAL